MKERKPFLIGGVDFSDVFSRWGYSTDRTPVYGPSVTTLDGVRHRPVIRWRGSLTGQLNALSDSRAAELFNAIAGSQRITYYSWQLGAIVTEDMELDGMPLTGLPGTTWQVGESLSFVQK